MNRIKKIMTLLIGLLIVGCASPPTARVEDPSKAGDYSYTSNNEGVTYASEVYLRAGGTGFTITCREPQYCLKRANDLCGPTPIWVHFQFETVWMCNK